MNGLGRFRQTTRPPSRVIPRVKLLLQTLCCDGRGSRGCVRCSQQPRTLHPAIRWTFAWKWTSRRGAFGCSMPSPIRSRSTMSRWAPQSGPRARASGSSPRWCSTPSAFRPPTSRGRMMRRAALPAMSTIRWARRNSCTICRAAFTAPMHQHTVVKARDRPAPTHGYSRVLRQFFLTGSPLRFGKALPACGDRFSKIRGVGRSSLRHSRLPPLVSITARMDSRIAAHSGMTRQSVS